MPKIKLALKDLILQKWGNDVENSNKCFYYKHFHYRPMLQNYLKILPESSWIPIIKFFQLPTIGYPLKSTPGQYFQRKDEKAQ